MDRRTALAPGTTLRLSNGKGTCITCSVMGELGRGRSGIVYEGLYYAGNGDRKIIRIKECYPYKLHIEREHDGTLTPSAEDQAAYAEALEQFEGNFSVVNRLFYEDGLYDSFVNTVDLYDFNNSRYMVSTYSSGVTLAMQKPEAVRECAGLVAQVALIVDRIHRAGYLYLDIKPENILYLYDGIQKRVQLFDFDSLIPYEKTPGRTGVTQPGFRLSYTKGFAAVELQSEKIRRIGPATDVFGIGALLFHLLYGRVPTALDCEEDAVYPAAGLSYDISSCDDRLLPAVTEFLHRTLAGYYRDRYQSAGEAAEQLQKIMAFADPDKKRVFSTRLYRMDRFFGREEELRELETGIRDRDCRCILLSGMGGIGKSTLVREFLARKQDSFQCLYLVYHDSIGQLKN